MLAFHKFYSIIAFHFMFEIFSLSKFSRRNLICQAFVVFCRRKFGVVRIIKSERAQRAVSGFSLRVKRKSGMNEKYMPTFLI